MYRTLSVGRQKMIHALTLMAAFTSYVLGRNSLGIYNVCIWMHNFTIFMEKYMRVEYSCRSMFSDSYQQTSYSLVVCVADPKAVYSRVNGSNTTVTVVLGAWSLTLIDCIRGMVLNLN